MFFPDKDKSYREVYRVLAPSGRYIFSVWDPSRAQASPHFLRDIKESISRMAIPEGIVEPA
jgi:SAM-dependent methyltransferase